MIGLIRRFFAKRRDAEGREIVRDYNTPLELATFYNNGATKRDKELVDEFLTTHAPDRYRREVEEFIAYLNSKKEPSDLEKSTR